MKITWFISGRCYLFIPGSKKIINDLWKISSVFSLLFLACNFSLFLRPQFFSRFFRYANLNWHWKLHRWNWLAEEFEFWYLNRPLHKANVSFCSYYSVWVKHKKFVSYNRIEKLNFKSSLIDFTFVVLLSSILEKNNPSLFRTCFFYGVFLRPELLKCHEQWFSQKFLIAFDCCPSIITWWKNSKHRLIFSRMQVLKTRMNSYTFLRTFS